MATAWVKTVDGADTTPTGYKLAVVYNLFGKAKSLNSREVLVSVLLADTTAQITTKVANAIIADASTVGLTIVGSDIKGG